ncbi:MAG: hypothetical protein E7300_07420 [Lachnospiraceae bacterium]|nr:hypothetical protein [Lachnospiraceae bacterium]
MSVNGISNVSTDQYNKYAEAAANTAPAKNAAETAATADTGVVYEKSPEVSSKDPAKIYTPNTDLVAKMKADAEERTAQLRQLVEQLMTGQGKAFSIANNDENMWRFLAEGKFEVDADTKAKAQADIAEDGYWGVQQTSDRILDFAKALSGGDPSKAEEMLDAFKKGYQEATGSWGKDLPDISSRTYDAVVEKFNKWKDEASQSEQTTVTQ